MSAAYGRYDGEGEIAPAIIQFRDREARDRWVRENSAHRSAARYSDKGRLIDPGFESFTFYKYQRRAGLDGEFVYEDRAYLKSIGQI